MMQEEVKDIVLGIIRDITDEELEDLDASKGLRDQLDLDSMDFLDIVMKLRKEHQVEVPPEDYPKLETLNSCVDYLTPKFHQ